jgi:hypothetical protein
MGLCEAFIRNLRAIGVAFDLLGENPQGRTMARITIVVNF